MPVRCEPSSLVPSLCVVAWGGGGLAHSPVSGGRQRPRRNASKGFLSSMPSDRCKLAALKCRRGKLARQQHLSRRSTASLPFSPLLAVLPIRRMITAVKENRPKERVRVQNEQPAPFPRSALISPSPLPPLSAPFPLSPLLSSSPPISVPAEPCCGHPQSVRGGHWALGTPSQWVGGWGLLLILCS